VATQRAAASRQWSRVVEHAQRVREDGVVFFAQWVSALSSPPLRPLLFKLIENSGQSPALLRSIANTCCIDRVVFSNVVIALATVPRGGACRHGQQHDFRVKLGDMLDRPAAFSAAFLTSVSASSESSKGRRHLQFQVNTSAQCPAPVRD